MNGGSLALFVAVCLILAVVDSTLVNKTLYHFYPSHLRRPGPGGISDYWLADSYNVAFYFLRTRVARLACQKDPQSFYCYIYNEAQPPNMFLYGKVIVEFNLDFFPGDDFNDGWGNYSTCALAGNYRTDYECKCGFLLNCQGLRNTRGRTAAHGFETYGKHDPYGTWYSLLAQKGQYECTLPDPPRCCKRGTCQGVHRLPPNPLNSYWYNTLKQGGCYDGEMRPNCTWRVVEYVKDTNATCHNDAVDKKVEELAKLCISQTPNCTVEGDLECYTKCYLETLVGKDSKGAGQGMSAQEISTLWTSAFESDTPGQGCPNVPFTDTGYEDVEDGNDDNNFSRYNHNGDEQETSKM